MLFFSKLFKKFLIGSVLQFDDANGGGGAGGDGGEKKEEKPPEPKKVEHTQEELDKLFADRARQGERAALDKLFKDLGVKDATELTTLLTEGKKLKESQLSDVEKAQAEKTAAENALATEKTERADEIGKLKERLLKTDVRTAAKAAGFLDASLDDVWLLVSTKEYREKIKEENEAFVGVDKVIEDLKKARPHWLGTDDPKKPRVPGSPRGQGGKGDGQDKQQRKGPFTKPKSL
jgi:hypothetical protein